jgi:hypothetical protein
MPREQQFEIPEELRQLAEDNVERARKLYLQFMEGVSQAMGVWSTTPSNTASPAFNEVRERAVKITQENADAAFKLAKDVANAKDGRLMAHAFTSVQRPQPSGQAAPRPPSSNQPKPGD